MENIIEVSNADQAPQENAGLSVNNPTVPNGEIPVNTGVSETITEETQEVSPRDDSTRFEYWQSQADKAKGELNAIRQELEYYRSNTNPAEQSSVSNGQPQAYPEQGLQEPSLKEPTAPERPHSYNEVDAYNDPQSESFKYRVAKESYRDKYLDFLKEKDQVREQEIQKQYQAQMQQQQTQMIQQQAMSHAVNNFGWEQSKAMEFVRWSQNPENLTLDNLAKLFELRTNPNPVVKQRTEEMQNQANRLNVPKTAVVQNGQAEQPRTDEQLFSDALLGKV
tara:strand:+ start:2802 stop:3638 length:837 start_codon:yes stop_codon:yes gene_type:complete